MGTALSLGCDVVKSNFAVPLVATLCEARTSRAFVRGGAQHCLSRARVVLITITTQCRGRFWKSFSNESDRASLVTFEIDADHAHQSASMLKEYVFAIRRTAETDLMCVLDLLSHRGLQFRTTDKTCSSTSSKQVTLRHDRCCFLQMEPEPFSYDSRCRNADNMRRTHSSSTKKLRQQQHLSKMTTDKMTTTMTSPV